MSLDLSIIIPTYNEAVKTGSALSRIEKNLLQVIDYMKKNGKNISYEIIVVDADSPDGTGQLVRKLARRHHQIKLISAGPKPEGQFIKGRQVALGFEKAHGDYVMFMDADLATPLKYLQDVFTLMRGDAPVGICVRNLSRSHHGIRKFVSNIGNLIVRLVLTPGIGDTQCGFKVFRADVAEQIFSQQRVISWGFDMEALALARKYRYPITLIDVPDWHDVIEGSKIAGSSALSAAIRVIPDLMRIKWGLLTGKYKSAGQLTNHEAIH